MAFVAQYNQDEDEEQQGAGGAPGIVQGAAAGTAAGAPGMGGAQGAGPGKDFTKSQFVSAKTIMDKNRGSAQADLTQPYRQQIGAAQQGLGSALDQYKQQTSGAAQQAKNLAGGVDKALSGDQESFSGIQNLLRGGVGVGQFEAPKSGVDEAGIQALGTQAGAASAMRQQAAKKGVTNYGAARSSLDAALFASDPMARQRNQELQKMRMDYGAQAEGAKKSAAEQAAAAQAEIAKQQEAVKGGLGSKSKSITDQATARAQQLGQMTDQQKLETLKSDPQFKTVIDSLMAQYGGKDPKTSRGVSTDITQYTGYKGTQGDYVKSAIDDWLSSYGKNVVKAGSVEGPAYTADQATQFNKIQELLGGDQKAAAVDAPKASIAYDKVAQDLGEKAERAQKKFESTGKEVDKVNAARKDIESQAAAGNLVFDFGSYGINEKAGMGIKGSDAKLQEAYDKGFAKHLENKIKIASTGQSKMSLNSGDRELMEAYKSASGGQAAKQRAVKDILKQRDVDKVKTAVAGGVLDPKKANKIVQEIVARYA